VAQAGLRGLAQPLSPPHKLPWRATEEDWAVVCAGRRSASFAIDGLTVVVTRILPHVNRHSIWRIVRTEGLSRRPQSPPNWPRRGQATLRDEDLGLIYSNIKHLPELRAAAGAHRERNSLRRDW
jgi:hypothetical protein